MNNKHTRLFWALSILTTCLFACQDTRYNTSTGDAVATVDPSPDAGAAPDAPNPTPDLQPDPTPTDGWFTTDPVQVHEGRIQNFGQLVAVEDRFAVVWIENKGQLYVTAAWIDPTSMEISEPITVSSPYDVDTLHLSPKDTHAAWTGSELAIAWAAQESIWLRRLRLDGTFVDEPKPVVTEAGENTHIKSVISLPSGRLGVVWLDDRQEPFTYLPWFANVDPDADTPQQEHQLLVNDETSINAGSISTGRPDPCLCNDRWWMSMSWHRRDGPGTPDMLKLTTFDQDGQIQTIAPVITRDTIQLAFRGEGIAEADEYGVHVGGWDVDDGSFVVQMMTEDAPSVVKLPRGGARPVLGASRVWGPAVLVLAGQDLLFYPPNTTTPLDSYAAPLLTSSVEENATGYALTGNSGGFGILWEENNTLWFAMARPVGP